MSRPALRAASASDVPALLALEFELFGPDAWSEASLRDELAGPGRRAVVLDEAGTVLGYAVTMRAGDVVDLQRIAVRPDRQRQGLAALLLADVVVAARDDGADRMLLEVSAGNPGAVAFYDAQGFSRIDVRRRYYRDGSDALVLARPLLEVAR
ncbi:MAG: GNAT family N-acetyltransferase [Nocardioides sp.]